MFSLDELKKMTEQELEEEVKKSQLDLLKLRMLVGSRQSKEISKLKVLRKYLARIKTLKRMLAFEKIPENTTSSVTK